ncbi:MAG: 3-phosphoserine/phosphohydroxythreonine transaminase [Gammaproteobacteria bacterium]|jgi:phosphoserine aminotransferase|nr:3-phosphoserine/phosphohydroxythreonine transaminase [Gammaproteobacteria bacterium]
MSNRAHNFCAGPAALPASVLQRAQGEMLDWQQRGVSVMEMSHRHQSFMDLVGQAEANLRQLLKIPDNYKVIFMQGGATAQFSLLPMNLLAGKAQADYIDTGIWSTKAIKAMAPYGRANIIGSSKQQNYLSVPQQSDLQIDPDSAYVHYCPNETIGGLAFDFVPETGDVPLVADMSSVILSEPVDVSQFGMIYAGAQKNIGPAGITLLIVRDDLLGKARFDTPGVFNYQQQWQNDSMLNTPPTFSWYLAALVFEWLLEQGGLANIGAINRAKAAALYAAIDSSSLYVNNVNKANRSLMNVTFTLADEALNSLFLQQAEANCLLNLKGHRSVGGMRASIYNAVPMASVEALIGFMQDFEHQHWS